MAAPRFRRSFYKLVPAWLSRDDGERVLFSLGMIKDAFVERVRLGLDARLPTRAGPSALERIGADRGIPRGRSETAPHYAARLKRWRYPRGHRTRGSAFALLEQIAEYWGGMLVRAHNITGGLHERTAAGAESATYGNAWSWDGDTAAWARFWVELRPAPDVPAIIAWPTLAGAWGGTLTPSGAFTLGQQGVTPGDVRAMRRLLLAPVPWKPAGTSTDYLVIVLDGTAIAPAGLWGSLRGRVTNAPSAVRFWRFGR